MKEETRELWKLCFGDSDDFLDLYFSRKYRDEINSCIVRDGRIVSALQRIPYVMNFMGDVIYSSYISGACTHPDFRSQGLMRELLAQAHRRMYSDGAGLAMLIPAEESLKEYYARSGYAVCFARGRKTWDKSRESQDRKSSGDWSFHTVDLLKFPDEEIVRFVADKLGKLDVCIMHDADDLYTIMRDLDLSGGQMWCVRNRAGEVTALALCIKKEEELEVKELLYDDKRVEEETVDYLLNYYDAERMICTVAPDEGKTVFMGMARIINVFDVLGIYAVHTGGNLLVEVCGDDVITENNGLYQIGNGHCIKTGRPRISENQEENIVRLDIGQLPAFLFKGTKPYMNLMLD